MTNKEMEFAIGWIRKVLIIRYSQEHIMKVLSMHGYTETEIRYCYVLATGKNMIV